VNWLLIGWQALTTWRHLKGGLVSMRKAVVGMELVGAPMDWVASANTPLTTCTVVLRLHQATFSGKIDPVLSEFSPISPPLIIPRPTHREREIDTSEKPSSPIISPSGALHWLTAAFPSVFSYWFACAGFICRTGQIEFPGSSFSSARFLLSCVIGQKLDSFCCGDFSCGLHLYLRYSLGQSNFLIC
jgi:hypothetical protein